MICLNIITEIQGFDVRILKPTSSTYLSDRTQVQNRAFPIIQVV